jgi:predicted CoA-binding protein
MTGTASQETIATLLREAKTIAVVGLSSNPERPSYSVAQYLQKHGYRVIPVNPTETEVLGEKSFASLKDIPEYVDIVDVFRRSEFVPEIADHAIEIGARALWLQMGVIHEEAAQKAKAAGLTVVMDQCIAVDHSLLVR